MLTPRQGFVLQAICDLYSETGEPVSSGAIAKLAGDAFSSATIRSEMARLEALGCVKQPHTSAGRIPTAQGYRYYINHLMLRRELPVEKQREIARFLRQGVRDPDILLTRASSLLAYMTNYAVLATSPQLSDLSMEKLEVVALTPQTLALVALTNTGLVLNQVCQLGLPAGERQLEKLSGFCRKILLHRPLHEVALLRDDFLQRELGGDYLCLAPAVQLICRMCAELCRAKVHLEGQSNLLRYAAPEHGYNAFLELLKETDTLLRAAPKEGGNVAVLLGDDLDQELAGTTLVSTGYLFGDEHTGVLGIIGPRHLDYTRIIPHLAYFTDLLGRILNGTDGDG